MSSSAFKKFNFYRYVPAELTEGSALGSAISIVAMAAMTFLILAETFSYLYPETQTAIIIDDNSESSIELNFDISLFDVPCEFATLDVVDVLGTKQLNVTRNVKKWSLDAAGNRRQFHGVNFEQQEIEHDEHHPSLEELHANGVHVLSLGVDTHDDFLNAHELTFVNYFAPWCVWCQRLAPIWEAFAEAVDDEKNSDDPDIKLSRLNVASVDCVSNMELCANSGVRAFPTLRVFRKNKQIGEYKSDRTVTALKDFVKGLPISDDELRRPRPTRERPMSDKEKEEEEAEVRGHPGCHMKGKLFLNRVPGNFHLEARSKHHNLVPSMTNLSHAINHLSFGPALTDKLLNKVKSVPEAFDHTHVLDDTVFIAKELHEAHHHYLKVVSVEYGTQRKYKRKNELQAYQLVTQSHSMHYGQNEIPQTVFHVDMSPFGIEYRAEKKPFYMFITSLMAIVGGTHVVLGLIHSALNSLIKPKKW
jgi:thiol-disulfide isomerase/thioredoxin